ncbi:hypothetical protein [Paenibacillus sp. FSL K6-1318]|uniref:hypothetical protein n=1 Tax=Paenibacillus sp. FSL K6-1318 TaxID=2975291 RepID=UPI0030ECFE52
MEMFKVDDNDIQGRLEFNKEWWSAAQEGEPMAGDEIREVRWLIELAGKQHIENERLRKELEDKNSTIEMLTKQITDEISISAAAIVERDRLRKGIDEIAGRYVLASPPSFIYAKLRALLGQEGEGNQ